MDNDLTFTVAKNAKRAAERMIDGGTAPSIDYGLRTRGDGRIEIVWKTSLTPAEADDADNHVDKEEVADDHKEESETEIPMPDIFPPGARVIVQLSARKKRTGTVDYRVDATMCRVKLDGPMPSILCRYNQLRLDDGSEPIPVPAKAERKLRAAPSGDRKPSKSAELDARAATGAMPTKPIITSPANREQYQKRFDQLEKWAMADDWDAVRKYEVKGINSYAKMVKQYRARLLAAHAASTPAEIV